MTSTVDEIQDRLSKSFDAQGHWKGIKALESKDGWSISVQVSHGHYCTPRLNDGPWCEVELGYPSESEPRLMDWAEDKENPTETVYGYVPTKLIADIIDSRGGLVEESECGGSRDGKDG